MAQDMGNYLASQMSEITFTTKEEMTNSPISFTFLLDSLLIIFAFFVSNVIKNGLIVRKRGIYNRCLEAMLRDRVRKRSCVCACMLYILNICLLTSNAKSLL